jgi:benzoyl-CoA reductase/2-hydroxyglutaryl-CoA dehydratase subunit BcrC/BadD/HgdB
MLNGSGLVITFRLIKENKMFDFKSVVDQVAKATKQPLSFVEDKAIRANLETLVDSYVNFTMTVYDTNLELSKKVVESTKSVDFTKAFEKFTAAK